jgi:hypothetical protein
MGHGTQNLSIEIPGFQSHISAVNRVGIDAAVLERCLGFDSEVEGFDLKPTMTTPMPID